MRRRVHSRQDERPGSLVDCEGVATFCRVVTCAEPFVEDCDCRVGKPSAATILSGFLPPWLEFGRLEPLCQSPEEQDDGDQGERQRNLKYHHIGIKAIYGLNMDHVLDAIIDGMHNPGPPQVARLQI